MEVKAHKDPCFTLISGQLISCCAPTSEMSSLFSKRSHNPPWHCYAVNFNLFVFPKFVMSVFSCLKFLCGDMEDQPETSSAVTTPVKLDR
jgi:hypothetical protein